MQKRHLLISIWIFLIIVNTTWAQNALDGPTWCVTYAVGRPVRSLTDFLWCWNAIPADEFTWQYRNPNSRIAPEWNPNHACWHEFQHWAERLKLQDTLCYIACQGIQTGNPLLRRCQAYEILLWIDTPESREIAQLALNDPTFATSDSVFIKIRARGRERLEQMTNH